ncbi:MULTISPECIES: NADPH-dependent FMN reductase [Fictibacillus]|uniref:NADPH-dependent FMN reductase n=1 Tax=Fictibacillus TaxID=1329200 RepID=UPI00047A4E72
MKIMVINGGPRAVSRTRGLALKAKELLQQHNIEISYFDCGTDQLPLYNGEESQREHPVVKKLSDEAKEADGFFICTPEYHSGMSGALKNAFDFLGGDHFSKKPVAIAAAAGGGKGGINALSNLRTVIRGVYGLVIPEQFVADPICFNESKEIEDEGTIARIDVIVKSLIEYVQLLTVQKENKKLG